MFLYIDLYLISMRKFVKRGPTVVLSGSCINFENERKKILSIINDYETIVGSRFKHEVSSTGNSMGWDFFEIYLETDFILSLFEFYPEITKYEGTTIEEQFVLWMEEKFKKRKLDYHLKLSNIPFEIPKGFRLDPNHYRNESDLESLR